MTLPIDNCPANSYYKVLIFLPSETERALKMSKEFFTTIEGITFHIRFIEQVRPELFQISIQAKNTDVIRFHMHGDRASGFSVMDTWNCPFDYLGLESKLSEAILKKYGSLL